MKTARKLRPGNAMMHDGHPQLLYMLTQRTKMTRRKMNRREHQNGYPYMILIVHNIHHYIRTTQHKFTRCRNPHQPTFSPWCSLRLRTECLQRLGLRTKPFQQLTVLSWNELFADIRNNETGGRRLFFDLKKKAKTFFLANLSQNPA